MKVRATIALVGLLALGTALTGCGREVEQTNTELTIYVGNQGTGMLRTAAGIFQETYPEVNVTIIDGEKQDSQEIADEAERLAAELMAGKGPDVFLINSSWDIDKMAAQRVFADLSPYFNDDPYFQGEKWEQKILEGGCLDEYRFAIPMEYEIPVILTSETALRESGIDKEQLTDFNAFMEETLQYLERAQGEEHARRLFRMNLVPRNCLWWAGYSAVDWEQGTVDLEQEEIRSFFEWYYTVEQQSEEDYMYDICKGAASIRDGEALFDIQLGIASFDVALSVGRLIDSFDKAVMIPIRNLDGGINAVMGYPLAVRANSANQLNAYRFIQICMSTEVQTSIAARQGGNFKVNREAQDEIYERTKDIRWANVTEGFPEEFPAFSQEEYDELMSYTEEVDHVIYVSEWQRRLRKLMMPYLTGESSYEDAAAQARKELEIYVSE